MGQFIKFGLCTKIVFDEKDKNKIEKYYPQFDDFISAFEKQSNINTKLFNLSEEKGGYVFIIKDDLLNPDSLNVFLKDFFNDIYEGEELERFCDKVCDRVKSTGNVDDLIALAKEKSYQNFQFSYSYGYIMAPWSTRIDIRYEYIVLYLNGKADMECYNELFSYIEKLLRLRHTHSQVWAMKVFLD